MKLGFILSCVLTFCSFGQTKVESEIKSIKNFLVKMNKRLTELEVKVADLEEEMLTESKEAVWWLNPERFTFSESAKKDELLALEIPVLFNSSVVKDYLKKIDRLTTGQESKSSSDYQVYLLNKIPERYFAEMLSSRLLNIKLYIAESVILRFREKDEKLLYRFLEQYPQLARVMEKKPDWVRKAWRTLIKGIQSDPKVSHYWIKLVAMADKSDGNYVLLKYLEKNRYLKNVKEVEKTSLEHSRIRAAVNEGYRNVMGKRGLDGDMKALCALYVGNFHALSRIIEILKQPAFEQAYIVKEARKVLKERVDTNLDIIDWYEQNKDRMSYTPSDKKFRAYLGK
ncbi:MAG: hypothetical protein MK132_02280 [Lentisphaerales bacterium]|nr:hypothetical protein [Lentisphaerales bacterium]